jgi:diguanylate cyclase (GGDEF)-like protein
VTLAVTGLLPVQFWGFVASASWLVATNVIATWVWRLKRPIDWHDRYYIFVDLVTVMAVTIAVSDMTYPVWLTLVLLMLAAAAEQTTSVARAFNACCVLGYVAAAVFLEVAGWHSVNWEVAIVTAVILALVAANISITFEGNHRLRRYIRHMAVTDPLTQIANRRSLSRLLASPPESGKSLAVAILDVDRFKQYNDEFGHLAGDRLLVRIAEALTEGFPNAAMISRFGGDEFVIVVPACSTGDVAIAIDNALSHREADPILVSVGVALWPDEQPTLDATLAAADDRLRESKRGRRGTISRLRVAP